MRPAIQPGDMIIAKVTSASLVRPNDVVMLVNPENWSLQSHRVLSITNVTNGISITTKGDANAVADKPVTIGNDSPIRKVSGIIPKFGYVVSALSTGKAKLIGLLVLIAFNIIIVSNVLVKRRKDDKKKVQEIYQANIYAAEKRENA